MELYYNKTDINQDEMFARTVINTVARKLREEVKFVPTKKDSPFAWRPICSPDRHNDKECIDLISVSSFDHAFLFSENLPALPPAQIAEMMKINPTGLDIIMRHDASNVTYREFSNRITLQYNDEDHPEVLITYTTKLTEDGSPVGIKILMSFHGLGNFEVITLVCFGARTGTPEGSPEYNGKWLYKQKECFGSGSPMDSCFQNICKSIGLLNEEVSNVIRIDLHKLLGDFVSL